MVDLFEREPQAWGGAYVDDGVLVVTTVTRSPDDALDVLASQGVAGSLRVRPGEVSLADVRAAVDALAEDPDVRVVATSVGADYRTGSVVVGVRHWFVPPWAVTPVPVPTSVDGIPVRLDYAGRPRTAN